MNTIEIETLAKILIPKFDGVFPIDQLPVKRKKSFTFILNIDSHNLPGTHWIAVIVRSNRTGFIFDSFGLAPPLTLQQWLNKRGIQWSINTQQVQPSDSIMCGYYCIYFLYYATSSMQDDHFVNIMKNIFFVNAVQYYNEDIIKDFANAMNLKYGEFFK